MLWELSKPLQRRCRPSWGVLERLGRFLARECTEPSSVNGLHKLKLCPKEVVYFRQCSTSRSKTPTHELTVVSISPYIYSRAY